MDLESRKISFVQEFLRLQNEDIIAGLEKFLHKKKSELFEENLKPMSLDQLNAETDQAVKEADAGNLSKAADLKAKVQKWG
jgi:hypothetical protein